MYRRHKETVNPHCSQSKFCKCGRENGEDDLCCEVCLSSTDVVNSKSQRKLVDTLMTAFKPVDCSHDQCNERIPDNLSMSSHHRSFMSCG